MKKEDIEILILVGGRGTRLASVVSDLPKPMAPINDKPFLELLINSIKVQNFKNFRLLVGHKAEVIQKYFGDGSKFDVNIKYSIEKTPLGTGGAVKQAVDDSRYDQFLIFNGDTLFEADLSHFIMSAKNNFAIALKYVESGERYGQVVINDQCQVASFTEKGGNTNDGFINAGIYYFSNKILDYFPNKDSFSIEEEVMPRLSHAGLLYGIPLGGKFIDIGIPEDFKKAQTYLAEFQFSNRVPALFLDRDGVIIKDSGYVSKISDVEIYPEIIPIIKFANQKNIPVYIITNQAGVAHGHFSIAECNEINQYIIGKLAVQGAIIEACFNSFYHPKGKLIEYRRESLLRKPNPGMILLAQESRSIDIEKSLMIGDKISDVIKFLGLQTILLKGSYDLSMPTKELLIFENHHGINTYLKKLAIRKWAN